MKLLKMTFTELLTAIGKAAGGKKIAALIWAFLASWLIHIAPYIAVMTILVVSDLITGIFAAWKRGERVNSKGLRKTIEKIVLYFIAITLSLLVQEIDGIGVNIVYWVAMYIIGTEFLSNIENISVATETDIIGTAKEFFDDKVMRKKNEKTD